MGCYEEINSSPARPWYSPNVSFPASLRVCLAFRVSIHLAFNFFFFLVSLHALLGAANAWILCSATWFASTVV